jgi:hypothetical protein
MFVDVANGILSNCNEGHVIVVSHSIIEILIKEKKKTIKCRGNHSIVDKGFSFYILILLKNLSLFVNNLMI